MTFYIAAFSLCWVAGFVLAMKVRFIRMAVYAAG